MGEEQQGKATAGRKRGGQPGNANALKHGFYSGRLQDLTAEQIEELAGADLSTEIGMMRVVMRKVFNQVDEAEDLESWSGALGALGAAATRVAGLLRTQQVLKGGSGSEIADALSQALREVSSEIGCK